MLRTLLVTLCTVILAGSVRSQPVFEVPKAIPPDEDTLKQIEAKRAELRKAVENLGVTKIRVDIVADVEIYLKAADWIVRHGEWFTKDSGKHTLNVLEAGLVRAKAAESNAAPWRNVRGKPVVRGYYSSIDLSLQPFSVNLPEDFGKGNAKHRLDIVLHGRDQTLTEVKFLNAKESAKAGKTPDHIVLEIYGRGNNAYRWAGETDVQEAVQWFGRTGMAKPGEICFDEEKVILRGFSMGGAGSWHLGLHHPFAFAAVGPGAGFTTTHGYIKNLPELPPYQEACLHIYDAVDYAENAFNVPIVAYSGEKDAQKAAADNIEKAVRDSKIPARFMHLVAPGLEHQMPAEWQAKAEAEYKKILADGRKFPEKVRFVTYTTRYHDFGHGWIEALDRHYVRTVIESHWTKDTLKITSTNVRAVRLLPADHPLPKEIEIDGQKVPCEDAGKKPGFYYLVKKEGRWQGSKKVEIREGLQKASNPIRNMQGPIDDAFTASFAMVKPVSSGWNGETDKHVKASAERFEAEWDKFLRGKVQVRTPDKVDARPSTNLVLFGDPVSNPLIAKMVEKLPIKWTKDELVVNGKTYDAKTHVPVLIYPNPLNPTYYVVINSGHTFHAADFQGTNALLYPRLGDWAVLKPAPTEKDPAAAEVAAAGLFDEFWQFGKEKR